MAHFRVILLILLALSGALGGCLQPTPDANPAELLKRATMKFHSDLRWQRFDEASVHLPADQREGFLSYYEDRRKSLFITEFEVVKLQISPDQKSAHAQILMTWYELPSTQVQTSMVDEQWAFREKASQWEVMEQTVSPVVEADSREH